MKKAKKVQLNLYLDEQYRDYLKRLAAKKTLKNPDQTFTASGIASRYLSEYLDLLQQNKK